MDPTACLKRLLDALEMDNLDEAVEAQEDLSRWLRGGGFCPPQVERQPLLDLLEVVRQYDWPTTHYLAPYFHQRLEVTA